MSCIHNPAANIPPNPKQDQQLERVASCIHEALKAGKDWCSIHERLTDGAQKILRDRGYMLKEITNGTPPSYSRGLPVGSTIINFLVDAHLERQRGPTLCVGLTEKVYHGDDDGFVTRSADRSTETPNADGSVLYGANGSVTYGADGSVLCHVLGHTADVKA